MASGAPLEHPCQLLHISVGEMLCTLSLVKLPNV
jgi:hypothetical protein